MRRTLINGIFALALLFMIFGGTTNAWAVFNASIIGSTSISKGGTVSFAATSTVEATITVTFTSTNGIAPGPVSISVAVANGTGFGSATFPNAGTFTATASSNKEGGSATLGTITVSDSGGGAVTPTKPVKITNIENEAASNVIYRSKKTEVTIRGDLDSGPVGQTMEILLDSTIVSSITTTSSNWGVTVSVPADNAAHTIVAKNQAGTSNSVQVLVDVAAPKFSITYDPASQPYTAGSTVIKAIITVTEDVDAVNARLILPDGAEVTGTGAVPYPNNSTNKTVYKYDITVGKNADGSPTVNNVKTIDGTCRFFLTAEDQAKPLPGNFGSVITAGETFTINTKGPSAAGASVIVMDGAEHSKNRSLSFKWQGFTNSLGIDKIAKYWAVAKKEGVTPSNDTADWTDCAGGGSASGNFTLMVDSDGTWSVYVKCQDSLGNISGYVSDNIIVDTIGPEGSSGAPTASGTEQTELTCNIKDNIVGIDRDSVTIKVNGATYGVGGTAAPNASPAVQLVSTGTAGTFKLIFTPSIIGLKYPKGTNNIEVYAKDKVGNPIGGTSTSPAEGVPYKWQFTVDSNTDAPVISDPSPKDKYIKMKRPPITLALSDPDLIDASSVTLTVLNVSNFMTFTVGPSLTIVDPSGASTKSVLTLTPPVDFADGTVTVTLQSAKDRRGNSITTPYSWNFFVDNAAPVPSDPIPANNTTTESTNPVISLKLDDVSGLDTSVNSNVSLKVVFKPLAGGASKDITVDLSNSALNYNPSTKNLTFIPSAASFALGVGSVEVYLKYAKDKATDINGNASPNEFNPSKDDSTAYKFTFLISTVAGPVVSKSDCLPPAPISSTQYQMTNAKPLMIKVVLADEDLINHSSLLIDINGRTYRDGDAQVSWQYATSSIMSGTHEAAVIMPDSSSLIQGTNTVTLRAASDRTGKALQGAPIDLSFVYDTQGPEASTPNPADGGAIYDNNNSVVKCQLSDKISGPGTAVLKVTNTTTSQLVGIYGTDSTPVNLIWANNELQFRTPTPYTAGSTYQFTVMGTEGSVTGTRDKLGNVITTPLSWSLKSYSSDDSIEIVAPSNDTFINVKDSSFKFEWKALTNADSTQKYKLEIASDLAFKKIVISKTTTATSYKDSSIENDLIHGAIYYWQVSALSSDNTTTYATSERRQFTVDILAPQMPKIVGIIDYNGLNPVHENKKPLVDTTYVKNRRVRAKVLLTEGSAGTVGYQIAVGYVKNTDGSTKTFYELGRKSEVHGTDTNEVDINMPDDDGEYRLVAYTIDRASNKSTPSEEARVYLNRKTPKISSIILTSASPGANAYITSGKVKFDIQFDTAVGMLPLTDYVVAPSVKFDPKGADGTAAIELTDLTVSGKNIMGYGYIPYGATNDFDGMADVIITGFLDKSWNSMDGGTVTYYKYFEIDTAPGFDVKTFINPVDEKNILINIKASETMLIPPSCYMTISNGMVNQLTVNIMAKNLYAASYSGSVGENNIRISGVDTRNNIGYWPTPDILKESKFLMAQYDPQKDSVVESASMGVKVSIAKNAMAANTNLYVLPYKLDYVGNNILASQSAKTTASAPARAAKNSFVSKMEALESNAHSIKIKGLNGKLLSISKAGEVEELDNNITTRMSDGSAYKASSDDVELTQLSMLYNISPIRNLKTDGSIEFDYNPTASGVSAKQAGVYYSADGILWDYVPGAKYSNGKFKAPMRATGIYGVFADKRAPVFVRANDSVNVKYTSNKPELSVVVSDFGSGIDPESATIKIDNVTYQAEYIESEGKVYFQTTESMTAGAHVITFEVKDKAGNISRFINNAIIPNANPGIKNAVAYPNPVRRSNNNAVISFTVDGTAGNAIDAKVYVYDVNANLVTELSPMIDTQGANETKFKTTWLGVTNDDGERVANGVYIYKIKVNCADKSLEKYGKVAILK